MLDSIGSAVTIQMQSVAKAINSESNDIKGELRLSFFYAQRRLTWLHKAKVSASMTS